MMEFRNVVFNELSQIWQIDRTEHVETIYSYENGSLKEHPVNETFYGWAPGNVETYTPIIAKCFQHGGFFWGGFVADKLKSIAILDAKWIGKHKDTLQLEFLHIDRAYRKQGIGRILFMKAVEEARLRGAKRLSRSCYATAKTSTLVHSSTENKNTVEFYKHLGCRITKDIEPELFQLEPHDIHMEYIL